MVEQHSSILDRGEPAAVVNLDGASPFLFVCEHSSNHIPAALGNLGLDEAALSSHIAWDIGAAALSKRLSEAFDAPLVEQRYSRLAYDCNRPSFSPEAIPALSERVAVPGNDGLSESDRQARIEQIYLPFHARISNLIDQRVRRGRETVLVTVHSFTPVFMGVRRVVDLGVLHDADRQLSDVILSLAARAREYIVKRIQPYGPSDGVTHTLLLHGIGRGIKNAMLKVRNDHIEGKDGQIVWADRLAMLLQEAHDVTEISPNLKARCI